MSCLPNFPSLPASVGGYELPDFLNCKPVGDGKLPARRPIKPEDDFLLKQSPVFGSSSGLRFDEGATWHPLRAAAFAFSDDGLTGFQGHYVQRSTSVVGVIPDAGYHHFKLQDNEYVTKISGHYTNIITSLTIHTPTRSVEVGQAKLDSLGEVFEFQVPAEHAVVNFCGHTVNDQITGLGVTYCRRLVAPSLTAGATDDPKPKLTPLYSKIFMDAATRHAWSTGDMKRIAELKKQTSDGLKPIYSNIDKKGDAAWTPVKREGQIYYVSYSNTSVMWSYFSQPLKADGNSKVSYQVVSIGSYSASTNMLGISGYIWENMPAGISAALIALGFTYFARPLIQEGITWGFSYAAQRLATFLAEAGVEGAPILVAESTLGFAGLVITGAIGILVAFGLLAFFNVIWKKYWLILNIYNIDPDHGWSSLNWYSDNASVSNGEWKTATISKFARPGNELYPPGFKPVETLDSVVMYLSVAFENDSTLLQGLGVGVTMQRDDSAVALAAKYVVHRSMNNEIGLHGIDGTAKGYNLKSYYENGPWVQGIETTTNAGGLQVRGTTPELGGAADNTYVFEVSIGNLPPVATAE